VQSAIEEAQRHSGVMPPEEEIARNLGFTLNEYRQALCDIAARTSTLETSPHDERTANPLRFIPDRSESSPGWIVERDQLQSLLVQAIKYLPKVERTIIGLYFMEELSLAEIGQVLKLHTSRVSQLKLQAVLRLRSYMQKKWPRGRASSAVTGG
jgi:RNA polymerase sigma factor for flagellar operon FliA